jgi:hypothetical protein
MITEKTSKEWYLVGMLGTAVCVFICCLMDHLRYLEVQDKIFTGMLVAFPVFGLLTLSAGVCWSRVGQSPSVVWSAVFGVALPFLLGSLFTLFDLPPNVHGIGFASLLVEELFSLITVIAMIVGTFIPKKSH